MTEFNLPKDHLAKRIKYYMKINDISEKTLCKLLGINLITLKRYLSSEREPKYTTVMNMAYIFNVSMDEFTGMDEILKDKYIKEMNKNS